MRWQMGKVRYCHSSIVDYAGDGGELLVRAAQEIFKYSKLIDQFKGGGVNGIASEITKEIGVFFEHLNIDTGAGEQEAQNHPRRSAPGYAAGGLQALRV